MPSSRRSASMTAVSRFRLVAVVLAAAGLAAAAAAAASGQPAPTPAAPLASFAGMDANQLPGVNPPDVQVAAGSGDVVETVNSSLSVWRSDGTPLRQESLGTFFSGSGVDRSADEMTDPRVLWDPVSSRWFALVFDISRGELDVAVSASSDPTGGWTVYGLPSSGCPDQPRLGTSDAVVVVTDDLFSSCHGFGRFLGGEVTVLSKPDLLNGVASPAKSSFGPDSSFAAITPAQSLGSTPTDYLVAVDQSGSGIQLIHVDSASLSSLPVTTIPLAQPLQNPPAAPQRSSTQTVDAGDNRIQNAVWEQGTIWLAADEACPDSPQSCGRVVELDAAAAKLVRDTTVALPADRSLLYPAVAPDALGNVVVAYCYSSPTDFPSLGYTYVRPDGVVAPPLDVAAGTSPNDSGRFGDYSGAARDPSNPLEVWIAGEVGDASDGTSLGWGSHIAAVQVPPQAPAVATTAATAAAAGAATVTATVYPEGQPTTYRVEYGATRAYGATTAPAQLSSTPASQALTISLPRLRPGTTYHLRLVATSRNGTSTGEDVTVRTRADRPKVSYPPRPALRSGALTVLRAVVAPGGAPTSVVFQYGRARSYGARTAPRRAGGTAATIVEAPVRLRRGVLYHVRAVAANAAGRAVGADRLVRG